MIRVRFTNFWDKSESVESKFFVPLLERVYEDRIETVIDPKIYVDVEIFSVHINKPSFNYRAIRKALRLLRTPIFQKDSPSNPLASKLDSRAKKRIWYTGENLRPPLVDDFDAYLTFDSNSYHEKNIYLPLWVLNLNWFGKSNIHGFISKTPTQSQLLEYRKVNFDDFRKREGVCAFVGVMEETRRAALANVSKTLETQIFGRSVNNPVEDKFKASRGFKFIMAFENSLYPGYITEKLLEANLTGAFPLYWGPRDLDYFNPDTYINLSNFENLESFNSEVLRLNTDPDELHFRLTQPIMMRPFDLESVIRKLKHLLL